MNTLRIIRGRILLPVLASVLLASHPTDAATQYAAGSITWDNALTAAWAAASGGSYTSQWAGGNDAVFEGSAGTVTLAGVTAHNLTFNATGYTLSGAGTLTLTGYAVANVASGAAVISAALAGATAYLRLSGDVIGGWMLARQAVLARSRAPALAESRGALARIFADQVLAQAPGLAEGVMAGGGDLALLDADSLAG